MSRITLNSNIASLNSQRRLEQSTSALRESFSRLSSGLRINRASDDAAGLAIASSLTVDRAVLTQGVRNINDGISLTNIADSALEELTSVVVRLQELANQSANGTLSGSQRLALDDEASALEEEFERIANSTSFNGVALLDGSFGSLRVQGGYGENGGIDVALSGAGARVAGDGTFQTFVTYDGYNQTRSIATADFDGDGDVDIAAQETNGGNRRVGIFLNNGDGTFTTVDYYQVDSSARLEVADFDGDSIPDILKDSTDLQILKGNGDGSFQTGVSFAGGVIGVSVDVGDLDGDGDVDIARRITSDVVIYRNDGSGNFSASQTFSAPGAAATPAWESIELGDLDGDGDLDIATTDASNVYVFINDGSSFSAGGVYAGGNDATNIAIGDFNNDDQQDLLINNDTDGTVGVFFGNGDGSFRAQQTLATSGTPLDVVAQDINGDNVDDILVSNASSNGIDVFLSRGDGTFEVATTLSATSGGQPYDIELSDFNDDGALDIVSGNDGDGSISIYIGNTQVVAGLSDIDLKTRESALEALDTLDSALEGLSQQRGDLGAFQSRLSTAVSNLRVGAENYASAASQITDVDVADASAQLVKNQILQQAGAAILAQANQAPALALTLLS